MEFTNRELHSTKFRVHLDDLADSTTAHLIRIPAFADILKNAVEQVHRHLYASYGKPLAVRSVTLVVEHMDGVAYTTGIPIDDLHKEIHLSLEYISHTVNDPARFHDECVGVVTHEMVHCYQHNCLGTAPGGLIEGIADFVRLKAGLAPPHWKKGKEESGKRWDEGYQKTAFFLEWLEGKFGPGSVSRINAHMDGRRYDEEKFWHGLFDESVDDLWEKYLKHWDDDGSQKPASVASTEPELVDLNDEEKEVADGQAKLAKEFHA